MSTATPSTAPKTWPDPETRIYLDPSTPSLPPWASKLGDPFTWVRDFALIGATTAFLAPTAVLELTGIHLSLTYYIGTTLSGAAIGGLLGWVLPRLLISRLRTVRMWKLLLAGLVAGAACGALAGALSALSLGEPLDASYSGQILFGLMLGAPAGALQLGWLWLPYTRRAVAAHRRWPLVAAACVASLGLGWLSLSVASVVARLF